MKILLTVSLLSAFSWIAYAGRESHGILPTKFVCALEPEYASIYKAELDVWDGVVTAGYLWIDGKVLNEFSCEDYGVGRNLSAELESTVFCSTDYYPGYRLELQESRIGSQVRIWQIDNGEQKIVEVLPCK